MQNIPEETGKLFFKHIRKELTPEEAAILDSWLNESARNREFLEQSVNTDNLMEDVKDWQQALQEMDMDGAWEKLVRRNPGLGVERVGYPRYKWFRYAVAAAVVVVLAGYWLFVPRSAKNDKPEVAVLETLKSDIAPGAYKATLKLADGRSIVLDSAAIGQLAKQGNAEVINKDGQLVYNAAGAGKDEVLYNTLSTSKGQTYPLLLSDNSRIWLNSESSIRFPVVFNGNSRKVEITGEVYFEVAHDANKPFVVSVNGMDVQVLGTTFNVKAYSDDDAIKTTLLEGSVKVKKGTRQAMIKPGQQAQVMENQITVISDIEVKQIIAWKAGFIYMNNEQLSDIMKDVARWYNIEVVYEGNAKNVEMIGRINRNANLSEFIKLLTASNIDAKFEGNKLILKAQ